MDQHTTAVQAEKMQNQKQGCCPAKQKKPKKPEATEINVCDKEKKSFLLFRTLKPYFNRQRELNSSWKRWKSEWMANSLGGASAGEKRWEGGGRSGGWVGGRGGGLDEPPSLAVALVQLVPGLGAGVAQGWHLVEQRVVGRLAEQRHQQGNAEASGALALHAHKQNERERVSDCHAVKLIFILSFKTSFPESHFLQFGIGIGIMCWSQRVHTKCSLLKKRRSDFSNAFTARALFVCTVVKKVWHLVNPISLIHHNH